MCVVSRRNALQRSSCYHLLSVVCTKRLLQYADMSLLPSAGLSALLFLVFHSGQLTTRCFNNCPFIKLAASLVLLPSEHLSARFSQSASHATRSQSCQVLSGSARSGMRSQGARWQCARTPARRRVCGPCETTEPNPSPQTLFAYPLAYILFSCISDSYIHYTSQLSAAIQPFNFASIQIIFSPDPTPNGVCSHP